MPRILVQVDAPNVFSFILDGLPKRKAIMEIGWKWVTGSRCKGCYVTSNKKLAQEAAQNWKLPVESNGTAENLGLNFQDILGKLFS